MDEYLVNFQLDGEPCEEIVKCCDSITARKIITEKYSGRNFIGTGVWKRYWKRLKSSNLTD